MNIKNEKGIALIMSIGIVAMLAIIGTTFAINMRLEQKASNNYLASIKAKTLAEAGIDHAIAVLKLYAITQAYSAPNDNGWYLGDRDGGVITSLPSTTQIGDSSKTWVSSTLQNYKLKLMDRTNWIYTITDNTSNTITCSSADFTGISSGEGYAIMDPTLGWGVKVIDCARQIYLNNGDPIECNSTSDCSTYDNAGNQLRSILNNLGAAVGASSTIGNTIVGAGTSIGIYLGYMTKEQVKQSISQDDYDKIKDYITTVGYVDGNLSPKRAPVNVNTADKAVLCAVLSGLSDGTDTIQDATYPITNNDTEAEKVANDIINGSTSTPLKKRPFRTWKEFENCIDGSVSDGDITVAEATVIKNAVNPNRTKPSTYRTEFCLHSGGNYEIISTGRAYDSAGNLASEKKIKAIANIFNVWNQTIQSQFAANTLYGLDTDTAGQVQILQTADSLYKQTFDTDMYGWNSSDGGAYLGSLPAYVAASPQGGGVLHLESGESAYVDFPNQLRILYVSMLLYATEHIGAAYQIYLSDTDAGIYGPQIRLKVQPGQPIPFEYEYPSANWQEFNPSQYTNEAGPNKWWDRIEIIADATGSDSIAPHDEYNVYFNSTTPAKETAGASYKIPFVSGLKKINRLVVVKAVTAASECYIDDFQIWCAGPMISNIFTTPTPITQWGTIAWTETIPTSPTPWNEIKLQLSSDEGSTWRGPNGSTTDTDNIDFYSSDQFGSAVDELGTTYYYVNADGNKISTIHNPSSPAIGSMKYLATLAVTNETETLPIFEDVTITYLPVTRILYWRGLGAGE